jgi:glycosyltransferase involved in cell wall biosynthesis
VRDVPVSAIVLTRDEEANIAKCLRSLARFDEVFVVDSRSSDRTVEIAQQHGAHVVTFAWSGQYPKKKQWALEHLPLTHDWILFLDADEEASPALIDEVAALFDDGEPPRDGYFIALDYVFLGRVLRHGHRVHKLALFDRRRGRFAEYPDLDATNMWEVEGHYQPVITGTTAVLKNPIVHADHDSLFDWFARHNRYSDWEAVLRAKGAIDGGDEAQPGIRKVLKRVFGRLPLKGTASFLYAYVLRLGFLDGRAGFQFAIAKAFYYWQVGLKEREIRREEVVQPTTSSGEEVIA